MEQGQDAVVGHRLLQDGCAELFPSRLPGMQEHGPHFGRLHGQAMGAEVNLSDASHVRLRQACHCPGRAPWRWLGFLRFDRPPA
jgi:hypothetical protein